jgi:hypothetical protein
MKLADYIGQVTELYDTIKLNSFYAEDVSNIFPPTKIFMLSCKGYIIPTGNYRLDRHYKRVKEWKFSVSGIAYIKIRR